MKNTRDWYRDFRSNLSHEILRSNVLPEDLQKRMLLELDKRLDVDVDALLASPKLKLQLSPAELDKQLLDLYNAFNENPSADIVRTVLGGANVGRQDYYIKEQARKLKNLERLKSGDKNALPQFLDDVGVGEYGSATSWIKKTLRRNLQQSGSHSFLQEKKMPSITNKKKLKDKTTMTTSFGRSQASSSTMIFDSFPKHYPSRRLSSRLPSLLI